VDHFCLGRGVTTAVDAGSAGCDTFPGFRAFAAERFRTRLVAFLNISRTGLSFAGLGGDNDTPGELESLRLVNARDCARCIEANRDLLVGVKIRLSDSIAADGRNEPEAYRRALKAAAMVRLPLMVHHSFSTVPNPQCPGEMSAGDIYTHMYHGFNNTMIDPATRQVDPTFLAAREKGVLFDIGHGQGSFNWTVAELAAEQGFWPDTISSDLHRGTCDGPCYDLPTAMSRLLRVGMPLAEVIRQTTLAPAKAIGWEDRIGSLAVGREADVAVFSLDEVDLELEDCQSQMRHVRQLIVPQAVWRAGEPGTITRPKRFPNPETIASQKVWASRLLVHDGMAGRADAAV
jgi:dihydroorotase